MVKSFIRKLFMRSQEGIEKPWAIFEISDFTNEGDVKITFNWNKSFIKKIQALGFHAETEEDSVQLFFYTSQMRPTSLAADSNEDGIINPSGHPGLKQ